MKTFSLVLLAITSQVFAAPKTFIDTLRVQPSLSSIPVKNGETCTDFKGKWKGICIGEGGIKSEQAFEVEQAGCSAVVLKTHDISIPLFVGGMITAAVNIPFGDKQFANSSTIETHWNEEKTKLNLIVGTLTKEMPEGQPIPVALTETVGMTNGRIVVDVYALIGESKHVMFCSFDRQP